MTSILPGNTVARKRRKPDCEHCDSPQVVPIIYGMPDPCLMESAGLGEVELGGCIVHPSNPVWYCRACGHRFGKNQKLVDLHLTESGEALLN